MRSTHFVWLSCLRAFGMILVLIYHFFPEVLPAGFIGVDVFFVFSGYLITSLLVKEFLDNGRIRLLDFYRRRVRRLLPAVLFMLLTILPLALLLSPDFRAQLLSQTAAVLGWVTNFYEIAHGQSYADNLMPHLFVHTWTLSIEFQFYLIWGAALTVAIPAFIMTRPANQRPTNQRPGERLQNANQRPASQRTIMRSRNILLGVALAVVALSYACMQLLRINAGDPSRAYFSTISHIYPLFIGSAVGLLAGYPDTPFVRRLSSIPPRIAISLVATSLCAITVVALRLSFSDPLTYLLGLPLTALLSGLIIALGRGAQERLGSYPEPRILIYLADRSYSLYLFHWPLYIIFTRAFMDFALRMKMGSVLFWGLAGTLVALVLTFVLAHLSYRFVEKPFSASRQKESAQSRQTPKHEKPSQHGMASQHHKTQSSAATRQVAMMRPATTIRPGMATHRSRTHQRISPARGFRLTLAVILAICSVGVLVTAPAKTTMENEIRAARIQLDATQASQTSMMFSTLSLSGALTGKPIERPPAGSTEVDLNFLNAEARQSPGVPVVTFVGDSVAFDPVVLLQNEIDIYVDVEVGRGMRSGVDIIQWMDDSGQLGEYVVIALATNTHADSYDAAIDIINSVGPGHRLVFVTAHGVYFPEMQALSAELRTLSDEYPFVTIADWDLAIASRENELASDGYHCGTSESVELYVQVVLEALKAASLRGTT